MNKFLVVVLCLIMGFAGFAFFATNNHGQAGIKEEEKPLIFAESFERFEEAAGQPLTESFSYLKQAKSAQFVDLRKHDVTDLPDIDFDTFKDKEIELNQRQISIISSTLKLNKAFLFQREGDIRYVDFCAFIPTYILRFQMENMNVQLVPCLGCNEINIEILKNGKVYSLHTFDLDSPGKQLFEDILYVTSNENEGE